MKNSKSKNNFEVNADSTVIKFSFLLVFFSVLFLLLILAFFIISGVTSDKPNDDTEESGSNPSLPTVSQPDENHPFKQQIDSFMPSYEGAVSVIDNDEINSENAILVDISDGSVIASKKSRGEANRVYPASITKVMSLIVVYENLTSEKDLETSVTISEATYNKMTAEGASGFGFVAGESFSVKDMIYAMILCSDGMATVTLAEYIAGSEAEFAKLMNAKADEMGLGNTHFTNATGLHSNDHYSTCQELAAIMSYAMKNSFCAEVLTKQAYQTYRASDENVRITFYSTFFNEAFRGYSHPSTGTIKAAKTGSTDEAKSCLVSYMVGNDGGKYVAVTTKAENRKAYVSDHLYIYETYVKPAK